MKKQYVQPNFEAICVSNEDVLTASVFDAVSVKTKAQWGNRKDTTWSAYADYED